MGKNATLPGLAEEPNVRRIEALALVPDIMMPLSLALGAAVLAASALETSHAETSHEAGPREQVNFDFAWCVL